MTAATRPRAALVLILAASFIVVLDFSIVNVALAAIERELHAGATAAQWVITAYAITFGGLLVLGGRIGDLVGRRRLFVIGLVLFSLASLAGGLAGNLGVLVAARAVQGVGAAVVAPTALSLVTTTVPEGAPRTRALGLYGATASVGFVAGLVLGGVLVQFFDWRAVFWVNVPIGLVASALVPLVLAPSPPAGQRARLDVAGAILVTGALAAVVWGVSSGASAGFGSLLTVSALVVALGALAAFVAVERRHASPLVRLSLFRHRPLRTANLVTVMLGAWGAGEILVVPLYFQLVRHDSALLTGLALAPQGIAGFLGSARGARLVARIGLRRYVMVSSAAAFAGIATLAAGLGSGLYPLLLVGLVLTGYGTSTGAFGATVAATAGVDAAEQGLVSGVVNMSRQVGAALGVAIAAALIGTGASAGADVGADRGALAAVALTALVALLLARRGLRPLGVAPATARAAVTPASPATVATNEAACA